VEHERRPAGDLLREATEQLHAADPADTAAVLRAAWQGFCVAGAAGQLLALCADPEEYPPLWRNARPVLEAAIGALRAAPSLPAGLPTEVHPAGGPQDRLDDARSAVIRRQILDLILVLNATLSAAAAHGAASKADRKACQDGTVLSSELGDCYEGRLRSFLNPGAPNPGRAPSAVRASGDGGDG
jgi:hypothetical protein